MRASGCAQVPGVLYRVKEGDTMANLATRFFTSVQQLLDVNPDVALRSGILTPFSRAADLSLPAMASWAPDVLTSDDLPSELTLYIAPGDELCVVVPVCDVRCESGSTCTFSPFNERASGGLLT